MVLALVALATGALRFERWRAERALARELDAQTIELDRQLAQLALVPRLLAEDPRVVAALAPPGERRNGGPDGPGDGPDDGAEEARRVADRLLERAGEAGDAAFVYLMDRTGLTVAASNWREPLSFVGADYGFRPYFRGAIAGREASFFAVGATTGEPGYFVARPVRANGSIVGVIAAKASLDALVDAWRARPHGSLVTDGLGVAILATDVSLLYAPSEPIDAGARTELARERRYALARNVPLALPDEGGGLARLGGARHVTVSRALVREPWRLHLALPAADVARRAAGTGAAATALALIAALLLRTFRQARRLAETEQRAARELERLVARRTAELQAAQRALIAESNFAMLGRMSAAINHEINQPLASLRLDLATLRRLTGRERPPLGDVREAVVDADRTVRRIGRVIETLRHVARQGTGELADVDLARLLDEVARTVRRERPAAEALSISLPGTPVPTVRGNAVLLQQAMLNLVHNGLDAVARAVADAPGGDSGGGSGAVGARVELALEIGDDALVAVVADDGPGVDPAFGKRLFEPFASGPESAGLGLGLALAHQIAVDHGGSLAHRSRPGGGSEFRLALPRDGHRP